jgi:hypothetical protein|tara:strand:- start:528 stop:722 length:195 start_codon:yes stop_codon:yes gene_type:complete
MTDMLLDEINIGEWVTIRGHEDKTMCIKDVRTEDGMVVCEHMDGLLSRHCVRDILYISKEYYKP